MNREKRRRRAHFDSFWVQVQVHVCVFALQSRRSVGCKIELQLLLLLLLLVFSQNRKSCARDGNVQMGFVVVVLETDRFAFKLGPV